MRVKQPAKAQPDATMPAKQPSVPGLPNPKQFHPGLPEDFFTRNYCEELAHKELASYVPKVKADAKLKAVLERIFTSKEPLGAGHSNAITLYVYSGYPLNNYTKGELIGPDIRFADLSGATITNTLFAHPDRRDNATNLHEVSFIGATMDNVVIDHDPSKPARYGFAHDLELGKEQAKYYEHQAELAREGIDGDIGLPSTYLFSPNMNYKILDRNVTNHRMYSVHHFHGLQFPIGSFTDLGAWHDGISPDETFLVCDPLSNIRDSYMCMYKLKEMYKSVCDSSKVMDMHFRIDPRGNYYPRHPYFSPDSQTFAVMYSLPSASSGHSSLISFFNAHSTECEGEFKLSRSTYIDYAALSFFDNETFMYITADDNSNKKNHLHILKRSETTRLKKTTVSWKEVASLTLPLPYAKELQTFPATERIGVQYRADGTNDFNQTCFYHLKGKKLELISSFPWVFEKRKHRLHPNGLYLVKPCPGTKADLEIISTTTGQLLHHIHTTFPKWPHFEFTPDGNALSIIESKGGLQNEQFVYPLPRAYPEHQVLHSHFEPRFSKIKFNLDPRLDPKKDAQIYPDATPSALKYIAVGLYDSKNNSQGSPDDTHSSGSSPDHSPPKNGLLANQLQQEIEKRNQRNPAPSAPPLDDETLESIKQSAQAPPVVPQRPSSQAMQQMSRGWNQRTQEAQIDAKTVAYQDYRK